jgi:arsenate reductase (thioredoxin)
MVRLVDRHWCTDIPRLAALKPRARRLPDEARSDANRVLHDVPKLGKEMGEMKKGVLFVCIGNSCRSTMAEALARHYWNDAIEAFSAGTYPLGHITPHTLEALSERAIATNGLHSKSFSAIPFDRIQLVVVLTGDGFEHLVPPSFAGKIVRWHVRDPFGHGLSAFRETRDTLTLMVRKKLPEWLNLDPV